MDDEMATGMRKITQPLKQYVVIELSPAELLKIFKESVSLALREAKMNDNENKLLTVAEVANQFGVTKTTIHSWCKSTLLTKHKIKGSNRTYFKYEDVQKALTQMNNFK